MKTLRQFIFSTFVILLSTVLLSATPSGKELQKTYTWKYTINKEATVGFNNYDCNLTIHTWDKGETEFRLTIDAEAKTEEDATNLDNYLQNLKFINSTSSVRFRSGFWENRKSIMGRMTMELEGGKDVELTDFSMKGELWIPSVCRFELNSKYSEIIMEDFSGPLLLDLYNDNLTGGIAGREVQINDKYSTLEFKDMKDIKADFYNTRMDAGNIGDLTIESKYSKINALATGKLDINSYNDKYSFTKTADINFVSKYSDLKTDFSGKINIDCYEGTIILKEAGDIEINSKYAEFQIGNAANISMVSSYSDKLAAVKVNSLRVYESKYCSVRIENLISAVTVSDGYSDKFTVLKTENAFKELSVSGKYVDVSLGLPKSADYRFRAKIQYPKLEMNETQLKPVIKVLNGSQLEYDAIKGTEKEGMPLIAVNGYQMSLKIIEL